MPEPAAWFKDLFARYQQDPKYILEELKLALAEGIEDAMEKQGISRADLARRLGTSPAYITKLLRGTYNPTLETVAKIAIALNARIVLSLAVQKRETERPRESGRPARAEQQTPVFEVAAVSELAAPVALFPSSGAILQVKRSCKRSDPASRPAAILHLKSPTVADAPRRRPKRKRE